MTSPTLISPNTGNYRIGKGALYFQKDFTGDYRHMGNATSVEFTAKIDTLEHFSQMEGVKSKDDEIVLSAGGELKVVLDEWTPANLQLALVGTVDEGASEGATIQIMDQDFVEGSLKFISNNARGPRANAYYHRVKFKPSASLNMISDEWGQIEVTGEVLVSQNAPYVGKFGYYQITNIDS